MRYLKPYKRIKEPEEPTRLHAHPAMSPEKRAEIEEAQINRERLHAKQMERYQTRKAAGVIGECRHCGINVYRTELPADMAMPCEVEKCPFNRAIERLKRASKLLTDSSNSPVDIPSVCVRDAS